MDECRGVMVTPWHLPPHLNALSPVQRVRTATWALQAVVAHHNRLQLEKSRAAAATAAPGSREGHTGVRAVEEGAPVGALACDARAAREVGTDGNPTDAQGHGSGSGPSNGACGEAPVGNQTGECDGARQDRMEIDAQESPEADVVARGGRSAAGEATGSLQPPAVSALAVVELADVTGGDEEPLDGGSDDEDERCADLPIRSSVVALEAG